MTHDRQRSPAVLFFLIVTSVFLIWHLAPNEPAHVQAQSPPIASSGLNTQIIYPIDLPNGQVQSNITGGTRPDNGLNLFHSFGEFGVPTNNIANFLNETALPTSNILGRVTGENPSNIFGTITTTDFGDANIFLMNPAGILFGPNATLDVRGSVVFTTANSLRLFDGSNSATFYANPASDAVTTPGRMSILSAAPLVDFGFVTLAAFGFLDPTPASITVQGSRLSVNPGQSISFVGGGFTMTGGNMSARSGQVGIVSVASAGEILHQDLRPAPNINGDSFSGMGTINLSQGAVVDVSSNAAGIVKIRGGQFVMANATVSADTINAAGDPVTVAIDINVTGDLSISNDLVPVITARTTGSGDAGAIKIASANFTAASNTFDILSLIDTHTSGSGRAGDVSITTGKLQVTGSLDGFASFIDTGTEGPGHGGNVTIAAQNVQMDFSLISTGNFWANVFGVDATGSAGNVNISTDSLNLYFTQIVTDAFSFANGTGQSGDITVTAHDISLDISQFSSQGHKQGGAITITTDHLLATDSQVIAVTNLMPGGGVTITGKGIELMTGSSVVSSTGGSGDAGSIHITATDHLGLLRASASDRPSGIFSNSFGSFGSAGNAGDIVITTPKLEMTGGARINTTTATSGHGGNVTINATDSISMSGETGSFAPEPLFSLGGIQPSGIFTRTIGGNCSGLCGDAGNISITTGSLTLDAGGQINSGTITSGHGGEITIHATDTISLSGTLSDGSPVGILSRTIETTPDAGSGGNITLTAGQSVTMSNGASVSASSTGTGNAGNISIDAGGDFESNGGKVSTTATQAQGGDINITAGQDIRLNNNASVSASSTGTGNAGSITAIAGDDFIMQNSSVTTQATQASGGNIKISAADLIVIQNSLISASVMGGGGSGGNISIDPTAVILQNSQILARAVLGNGGNISIITPFFLADSTSRVSASSDYGLNGTVTIQSPTSNLSGSLGTLSSKTQQVQSLLTQRCAALANGQASSFVVAGREQLPSDPGGWLTSPIALAGLDTDPFNNETVAKGTSNLAPRTSGLLANGNVSLRRLTPARFLMANFADSKATGCHS